MSRPTIWQSLKKSFVIARRKEILVGRDTDGNKFYEQPADKELGLKLVRRVESAAGDTWNAPVLNAEWMSWLQRRRIDPPTPEEIKKNYIKMLTVKQRAMDLEIAKGDAIANVPAPKSEKEAVPFPTYDDLETYPGQKDKEDSETNADRIPH